MGAVAIAKAGKTSWGDGAEHPRRLNCFSASLLPDFMAANVFAVTFTHRSIRTMLQKPRACHSFHNVGDTNTGSDSGKQKWGWFVPLSVVLKRRAQPMPSSMACQESRYKSPDVNSH